MKGRWFRFYDDALDDPKVQRLSGDLFKTWVNVLSLASKCDGTLPSCEDIAFRLRISVQDAEQRLSELILAGLVDILPDGTRAPHNWNGRQFASDTSAERTRKYRENKRKRACDVTRDGGVTVQTQTQTQIQTEKQNKSDSPNPESACAAGDPAPAREKSEPNDATEEIVSGVAKFLNRLAPDRETAKRIVRGNQALYGDDAVRNGYAELMADVADNKVRIPSAKILVGYFKSAHARPPRAANGEAAKVSAFKALSASTVAYAKPDLSDDWMAGNA